LAVAQAHPGSVVIGSDQVCDLDGVALGKPHTFEKAVEQLERMQSRRLVFHTAVCVVRADGTMEETVSDTIITMRPLSRETIEDYVRREEPYDCAGSAKIEKLGIALMQSVESDDPTSLIGLPLMRLTSMLANAGIPALAGLKG
jgi:septum formation protein